MTSVGMPIADRQAAGDSEREVVESSRSLARSLQSLQGVLKEMICKRRRVLRHDMLANDMATNR